MYTPHAPLWSFHFGSKHPIWPFWPCLRSPNPWWKSLREIILCFFLAFGPLPSALNLFQIILRPKMATDIHTDGTHGTSWLEMRRRRWAPRMRIFKYMKWCLCRRPWSAFFQNSNDEHLNLARRCCFWKTFGIRGYKCLRCGTSFFLLWIWMLYFYIGNGVTAQ